MISFVGAGPGASDLITLRGYHRLQQADIVIWASSLIPNSLITSSCKEGVKLFDSASMTLEDVLAIYEQSGESQLIVRLHSGDPSVYGAIQEQMDYLIQHQLDFEVVPGVTSVAAASAALHRELTIPGVSQSIVFTRLPKKTSPSMPDNESIEAYARVGGTLAIFLSGAYPKDLQRALLCERSQFTPDTPAAILVRVSWGDEKIVRTHLGGLAASMSSLEAKRTVLVLVGEALREGQEIARSHLYNPGFAHRFRKRSKTNSSGRPTRLSRDSLK